MVATKRKPMTVWDEHRTARVLSRDDELAFGETLPGIAVPIGALFK